MKRIDDLSRPLLDKLLEAIDSGEKDQARNLAKEMARDHMWMHDSLIDTIQDTLTYISEKVGEESIEDVWRYLAQIFWQSAIQMFKDMDHDKMTKQIAAGHRAHGSEFYVEQDDEKTVFVVTCCGAGGKLRKEGKLDYTDRHPRSGGATKKPYPWSCDQTGVPYYCVHAPVMFNILPREWGT